MYTVPLLLPTRSFEVYPYLRYSSVGFGNLLFPFFRALIHSVRTKSILLYPFISSLPSFYGLRYRSSPRSYSSVFLRFSDLFLSKASSFKAFHFIRRTNCVSTEYSSMKLFYGIDDAYTSLNEFKPLLTSIVSSRFDSSNLYHHLPAIHVRLGDFLKNKQAISLDRLIYHIRQLLKHSDVVVYSDTPTEVLKNYFDLTYYPNRVIFDSCTSCPMQSILRLASHSTVVGNHLSSFFTWAKFFALESTQFFTMSPAGYDQAHLNGVTKFAQYV